MRKLVNLGGVLGIALMPALAGAGITFDASRSHRELHAEVSAGNNTDVSAAIPPADRFAPWSPMPVEASASSGDPVDEVYADAVATQASGATPVGITLIGSAQGNIGNQPASIERVESEVTFAFDADSCMQFFAQASLGESNAGQGHSEFFQFSAPLDFDFIVELESNSAGPDQEDGASGQISPGHYLARGWSYLYPEPTPPPRGSYYAPAYALAIELFPCVQPLISQQPSSQVVAPGAVAALAVVASPLGAGAPGLSAAGALTYQWRHGGQDLVDDGRIAGATTANLQIADFGPGDRGGYVVVVSDGTTQAFSSMAILELGQADADGDGILDAQDRCPHYASAQQTDTDGDGRGDVCECGDQDGDGRNTVSDLVAINRAIFDPGLVTALCDANGDASCNVVDIVETNVEIFSAGNTSTCARQPVPGP